MVPLFSLVLVTSPLLVASLAPFHYADNPPAYQDRGSPVRVATISPASSSSTVGNKSTSPANTCFDKPDNYTAIEPGTKCRRYFRCSGGARQSVYLCPGKLVFNGQRCVHPSDFDCTSQSPTTQTVRSSSPSPPVDVKRPEVNQTICIPMLNSVIDRYLFIRSSGTKQKSVTQDRMAITPTESLDVGAIITAPAATRPLTSARGKPYSTGRVASNRMSISVHPIRPTVKGPPTGITRT